MSNLQHTALHEALHSGNHTLPRLLQHWARTTPDALAFREKDLGIWNRMSWRHYHDTARRFALGMLALGFRRGDRLAIASEDTPEWMFADLGTQYLTFDQARNELTNGDVKDRNPFKDLRVRRAVAHAIHVDLIIQKVLRGQATATGSFISPLVDGYDATLDKRLPYDPARAKALLAEAGYANGFGVTLDCVNVAWREAVCQAAAAMLTQVGIRTQLRASPTNQFFPKLSQGTASFIEYGWTPTTDPWSTLNSLVRTYDPAGGGTFNAGRYSNPQLDPLIDAVRVEPDLVKRRARVGVALRLIADDMPYLPLYRRTLNWAMAKKVQLVQWPNDTVELRWVKVAP